MRPRTTIILILLLLGLGAYVYWIELPKAEQEAKKKTLFEFKVDDATEVTLTYADREVVLKKSGDNWRLTKPIDAPADEITVKNLVGAVAECEVKKTLEDASANLAQYGLDQPFAKVTVKLKDRELPTVLVGKTTPVGFNTYIQKTDEPKVFLTSSAFRSGMDKKVKDLRDKTILTFDDNAVQKVVLHGDGKDITLVQKDGTWNIESPGPYASDTNTVHSFLSTLRSMRAVDFPDDQPTDLGTYGLDQPRLKVSLFLGKENAEKSVLIGKETDKKEIYIQATGQPTVYTVSEWIFRDLNKSVEDLRDKTLFAFERDKITAVDVKRHDGGHFKLVRGDDKHWRVEGAGEGKPAETVISQALGDLHDLKGYEIAADHPSDLAPFGLDQPRLTVTVFGEENKPLGTLLIGLRPGGDGKDYTAILEGGPTAFRIRDYLVTRLDKQPQDFLEKPTPTVGAGTPPPQVGAGAEEFEEEPVEDEPLEDSGDDTPAGEQD